MKRIFVILLVFGFAACKPEFLEEEPISVVNNLFYTTQDGLEALVTANYQLLRFKTDYNHGNKLFAGGNDIEVFNQSPYTAEQYRRASGLYDISSWGPTATDDQHQVTLQIRLLLGAVSGGFSEGVYPSITRCNLFLYNYENFLTESEQEGLKTRKGEILFMRAYGYYLVTNVLGPVPLILEAPRSYSDINYFPKSSLEDIYKSMISDLRNAVEILNPEIADPNSELGRITKPAAAHLLAKIYLHRAQAAGWQGAETHLDMLYKGNVPTDLDSSIYYASMVIDQKSGETAYGGLAPNFGDLWATPAYSPGTTSVYSRDLVSEIILSAQYEGSQTYNGRYVNQFHNIFNQDFTVLDVGLDRSGTLLPRPFRDMNPTDWAYDMFNNRAADSRFYKSFFMSYESNNASAARLDWTDESAYFYNNFLKTKYPNRYGGEDVVAGTSKIEQDQRCLGYIENSKDEPVDSLWLASQPYLLLARWVAGSPNGEGYFNYDGSGNVTGLKAGITIDPDNPVITDVSNRTVRYRIVPSDQATVRRYNTDAEGASAITFLSSGKFFDPNRGLGTDDRGGGSIDIPLIRLAETYLIRAEALGRRDGPAAAIPDLNVIRRRAAYKAGEAITDLAILDPSGVDLANVDNSTLQILNDTEADNLVDGSEWQQGTAKAAMENYPPTATTEMERFIHFIYNEKAREHIFEAITNEDLHNAGIWYERVYYRDPVGAPSESTGTADFPFPVDPEDETNGPGGIGATGYGRGQLGKYHNFKAWPLDFLQLLTDEEGIPYGVDEFNDYQNPGY